MKKSLILLPLFLMCIQTNAQTFYAQTTASANYTDLSDAVSINNNMVWYNNEYDPIEVPFSFKITNQTITHFTFRDDNFAFITGLEETAKTYLLIASGIFIEDRNYSDAEVSQSPVNYSESPISYKVEGTSGNRILKMEVKNAGSTSEVDELETNTLFVNFQVWVYEGSNIIEYHYGDTNITADDMTTLEDDPWLIGIAEKTLSYGCFVYGNPASVSFAQLINTNEDALDEYKMASYPSNGTVYRFTPSTTAGTEQFNKTQFSIYPNPVTSMLNISLEKMDVTDYIITDMTGKTIQKGTFKTLENTIEVGDLSSGMYGIKIGNTTQKFLKK